MLYYEVNFSVCYFLFHFPGCPGIFRESLDLFIKCNVFFTICQVYLSFCKK